MSKDEQIRDLTRRCEEMAAALRDIKAFYDLADPSKDDAWFQVGRIGGRAMTGLNWALSKEAAQ